MEIFFCSFVYICFLFHLQLFHQITFRFLKICWFWKIVSTWFNLKWLCNLYCLMQFFVYLFISIFIALNALKVAFVKFLFIFIIQFFCTWLILKIFVRISKNGNILQNNVCSLSNIFFCFLYIVLNLIIAFFQTTWSVYKINDFALRHCFIW